jgi:hypothetical protein
MVPLYWDDKNWGYKLAGEIIITPAKMVDDSIEVKKNPFLEWNETISPANDADTAKSKAFLDNFFTFLYSKKDISPYYEGELLHAGNVEYLNMVDYVLYSEANINGYNAIATINVMTNSGMTYATKKYVVMEKSGNSWIIRKVL